MLQTIIGLLAMVLGFLMVIYSRKFFEFFGPIEWAEKHIFTEGGSDLAYKILGILIIFIGLFILTGWIKEIILLIFPVSQQ